MKLPVATQAPGRLWHSGVIRKELNTVWLIYVLLHLMRLIIWCALCMKKEQLTFNFWYCALWSWKYSNFSHNLVYPNYFVFLNNVSLARYPENQNPTCIHGGHLGAIFPKFFCAANFVLPRKTFIKKYNKNRSFEPLKTFCFPLNL